MEVVVRMANQLESGIDESRLVKTKELAGKKIRVERPKKKDPDATKKLGRIRAFVFHPSSKRCVGFMVKRPDVAWMFHRADSFVAYNGYDLVDDVIVVREEAGASGKGACKALGIDLDECVIWVGLPVMCADGTAFGTVDNIAYDSETGLVAWLDVSQGATANVLLGVRRVEADDIIGFKRGIGARLVDSESDDPQDLGALLVADSVRDVQVSGGVAEKAGVGAAVVGSVASQAAAKAKPKAQEAAKTAGKAVNKAAFVTGRQVGRTKGMFSAFKDEFNKALHEDDK
jgi:uncharacterized protein YrrD